MPEPSSGPEAAPTPPSNKVRPFAVNAAVTLISTSAALFLVEFALRLVGFSYPLFPEKIQFGAPNPAKIESAYLQDEDVFWVPKDYFDRLKEIGKTDIVYMGDSCTHNGTFPQELSKIVEARFPGKGISYASLGVTGWSSFQGLQQLKRDVLPLKPKCIFVYFGWNDHWIGFGIEDKYVGQINKSLLYTFRNVRLVQLVQKAGVILSKRGDSLPKRVSPEDFGANLRSICRVAKANGIIPMLLTAPSAHEPGREPASLTMRWIENLDDLVPMHQQYVDIVRKIAAEEGAVLCDLAKEFEALPRAAVIHDYFRPDGIHFYSDGDKVIAESLFRCMEKDGVLAGLIVPKENAQQHPQNTEGLMKAKPQKGQADPALPTRIEIEEATRADDRTSVRGYVFSPRIIDYVVVSVGGKALGAASYPEARSELVEKFPEYKDPFGGFDFERRNPPNGNTGRIEVYSGAECIAVKEFEITGAKP
jgi:lysophospholipase L1-like esterase